MVGSRQPILSTAITCGRELAVIVVLRPAESEPMAGSARLARPRAHHPPTLSHPAARPQGGSGSTWNAPPDPQYLADWQFEFGGLADRFAVKLSEVNLDRMGAVLDRRLAEWRRFRGLPNRLPGDRLCQRGR
jgi:hypothetical protein